jgi:hypothetical protein
MTPIATPERFQNARASYEPRSASGPPLAVAGPPDVPPPAAMGGLHTSMFIGASHHLVAALAVIAYAAGATALHCSGCKDRTGVLVAAFLL